MDGRISLSMYIIAPPAHMPRWGRDRSGSYGSGAGQDALLGVDFDDVADFVAGEFFEDDAAFVAAGDFAYVVFTTAQRGNFAVIDFFFFAHDSCLRGTCNFAVQDSAAGYDCAFACFEDLLHLFLSLDNLAVGGFQHACQGGLDIVYQLINDIIVADFDTFFLCQALRSPVSLDAEADNDGVGGTRQVYVGLVDVADTLVYQAYLEILVTELGERILDSFG